MKIDISKFKSNKELHKFIIENKHDIIAQKKEEVKHSKGVPFSIGVIGKDNEALIAAKALAKADLDENVIVVEAIINTTNLVDSHKDLHLPGIWNKSLKENNRRKHLQEHQTTFDKIIASGEDVVASAIDTTFEALGVKNLKGATQALLYKSTVRKERNPYMFNQYKNGWVEEHSVGMQYVKISTAVNDEDYKEEFSNWNKYYDLIANKSAVDNDGYFFIVHEAKEIEGSAVAYGSNYATPTYSVQNEGKQQQSTSQSEQPKGTHDKDFFSGW